MEANFTRKCKENEYLREKVLLLEKENEELRREAANGMRAREDLKRERKSKAHAKEKQAAASSENAILQEEIKNWQHSQTVLLREIKDLRSLENSLREENKSLRKRLAVKDSRVPSISFAADESLKNGSLSRCFSGEGQIRLLDSMEEQAQPPALRLQATTESAEGSMRKKSARTSARLSARNSARRSARKDRSAKKSARRREGSIADQNTLSPRSASRSVHSPRTPKSPRFDNSLVVFQDKSQNATNSMINLSDNAGEHRPSGNRRTSRGQAESRSALKELGDGGRTGGNLTSRAPPPEELKSARRGDETRRSSRGDRSGRRDAQLQVSWDVDEVGRRERRSSRKRASVEREVSTERKERRSSLKREGRAASIDVWGVD